MRKSLLSPKGTLEGRVEGFRLTSLLPCGGHSGVCRMKGQARPCRRGGTLASQTRPASSGFSDELSKQVLPVGWQIPPGGRAFVHNSAVKEDHEVGITSVPVDSLRSGARVRRQVEALACLEAGSFCYSSWCSSLRSRSWLSDLFFDFVRGRFYLRDTRWAVQLIHG
jgi:hypothetical protein